MRCHQTQTTSPLFTVDTAAMQLKKCQVNEMQGKFIELSRISPLMHQRMLVGLPDSILRDILSNLYICDLLRAQLTSLAWHHAI